MCRPVLFCFVFLFSFFFAVCLFVFFLFFFCFFWKGISHPGTFKNDTVPAAIVIIVKGLPTFDLPQALGVVGSVVTLRILWICDRNLR